jgi:hypothetical protein
MTTITLPPDLEAVIEEKANRHGTTAEMLVLDDLRARYLPPTPSEPSSGQTLADHLDKYIGSLDSSDRFPDGSNASEDTGRQFKEIVLQKYRSGKL